MLCRMPPQEGPLGRLRRGHEELVLDLLRRHGRLSRGELGRHSGLSRTTLYDIVATLVHNGAIVVSAPAPALRKRGRPVETLTLNPHAGQAIGIDFARRAVHVAAVNVAHEVIGSASEPHDAELCWRERVDIAGRLVGKLAEGALRLGALNAIGVGVVGPVADGGDAAGPSRPGGKGAGRASRGGDGVPQDGAGGSRGEGGLRDGGLRDGGGGAARRSRPGDEPLALLRARFDVPVLLDNNTRLAALAEATWGAAAGDQDVLYLRLSHGVGGGLVVGGSLHRGAWGLSGELGHIRVEPGGRRCSCGGTGCLETVASVGAVLDAYRAAGGDADQLSTFLARAEAGDRVALGVLDTVGTRIGSVLAAVCNAVGPGVIVLGGELAQAGTALFEPVERALGADVLPLARHRVDLRRAALSEAGGALGAIALVLHESPLLSRYPARSDTADGDARPAPASTAPPAPASTAPPAPAPHAPPPPAHDPAPDAPPPAPEEDAPPDSEENP